jgi:predicted nucleic acid-binding protein
VSVLDASVVIDALVSAGTDGDTAGHVLPGSMSCPAPHLLDVEVLSALRRLAQAGDVALTVARQARAAFADLPIDRYPLAPFEARVWELRDEVSSYDGWYVALAEALGTELVTADDRLRRAIGARCPVVAP